MFFMKSLTASEFVNEDNLTISVYDIRITAYTKMANF